MNFSQRQTSAQKAYRRRLREFVMVFPVTPLAPAARQVFSFQIVLNWLEELKARVPVN